MEKVVVEAKERKTINKRSRNNLRNEGRVPGVLYGSRLDPIPIDVTRAAIHPLVFTAKTHLLSLKLDGHEEYDCIIKDVQFDPVSDEIIHFDLIGLTRDEKIQLEVPIRLLGSAVGVKEGGLLQESMHKLNVECLPNNIPQSLEIDVTELNVGDSIHVADLSFEHITIINPEDTIVVSVVLPKVEQEVEPDEEGEEFAEEEGADEPEVIGKGKEPEEENKD
ncbi:MAG: 50S ribosomal protein L25 [Bacteroidetes bacterium]|nr:50S ribosomal protein L25 [Bacteroidota bacterium]MCH8032914.1 50S ribosomal protein L25 [Bacteroidota bacterium]